MQATTATIYSQLVVVSEKYLGPAAERFIRRQVDFHLDKQPEDITAHDVVKLADSVKIALGVLTQDEDMINKAVREVKAVARQDVKA